MHYIIFGNYSNRFFLKYCAINVYGYVSITPLDGLRCIVVGRNFYALIFLTWLSSY